MKELSIKDLARYKAIPFCIYNVQGEILMYAGETLTPGKLLELKEIPVLLYNENHKNKTLLETNEVISRKLKKKTDAEKLERRQKLKEKQEEYTKAHTPQVASSAEMIKIKKEQADNSKAIEENELATKRPKVIQGLNQLCVFSATVQQQLIDTYKDLIARFKEGDFDGLVDDYHALSEKIQSILTVTLPKTNSLSKYKLLGEYKDCHELNVAILSGAIGMHLNFSKQRVLNLIMAGLIHDIGRTQLDEEIAYEKDLTKEDLKEYSSHVAIGYGIAKDVFQLNNFITRAIFEHHEYSDGSGYPKGTSYDYLSEAGRILIICNNFDNLTSNRTKVYIENAREALLLMLKIGSQKFSPTVLYTLSNKFTLNDTTNFKDIVY